MDNDGGLAAMSAESARVAAEPRGSEPLDLPLARSIASRISIGETLAYDSNLFRLPAGAGRVSLVSRDELAQAIAAATLAPRLDKRVYELTGQAAFPYADIAARIARVSGRPLSYEDVSVDAYAGSLVARGVPAWHADAQAGLFASVAAGLLAAVSHDFAALVGHPPKSLDCLIHEYFAPRSPA